MSKTLSSADFFNAKPELKQVDLPGGTVFVRSLSGEEQNIIEKYSKNKPGDGVGVMARMVAHGVCNEAGDAIFDLGDLDKIRNMPFVTLNTLADEVIHQSGMGEGDAEDIEKKS